MNEVLFEVLKAVIIVSIMAVMRYLIPYLKETIANSKYAEVAEWANKAVLMAEQTIIGTKTGAEKKAIVIDFIKKLLTQKHISISDDQLNTLIESAVYAMNRGGANA